MIDSLKFLVVGCSLTSHLVSIRLYSKVTSFYHCRSLVSGNAFDTHKYKEYSQLQSGRKFMVTHVQSDFLYHCRSLVSGNTFDTPKSKECSQLRSGRKFMVTHDYYCKDCYFNLMWLVYCRWHDLLANLQSFYHCPQICKNSYRSCRVHICI